MKSRVLVCAAVGALSLVVSLGACKPKPGGSCKIESAKTALIVCVDEKQALSCHDGKWEEMSCRGARGCSKTDGCDQDVAEEGDTCALDGDFTCAVGKKSMLTCEKHKWATVEKCLGEGGCAMINKKVTCDNLIAAVGDACLLEEDYACTADHKATIVCRGKKFVPALPCKGPKGCYTTSGTVHCDGTLASVGDTCDTDGNFVCSEDRRSILRCVNRAYQQNDKCRTSQECATRGGLTGCY